MTMEGSGTSGVPVKVVVVGDCQCGKTCLVQRYTHNTYTETYQPTGFETHTTTYSVSDSYKILVSIWDTSGNPGLGGVRPLSYDGAHLVIVCFSIADPDSFDHVTQTWLPEVRENCSEQPILLVGCKSDLRLDETQPIKLKQEMMSSYEQGLNLAKEIGALVYTETSAKTTAKSVRDMFEVAALSAAATQPPATVAPKRPKSFMRRKHSRGVSNAESELRRKTAGMSCAVM